MFTTVLKDLITMAAKIPVIITIQVAIPPPTSVVHLIRGWMTYLIPTQVQVPMIVGTDRECGTEAVTSLIMYSHWIPVV